MKTEMINPPGRKSTVMRISIGLIIALIVLLLSVVRARGESESVSDEMIALAVENQILSSEAIDGHSVDADCRDGLVTLSGHVGNLLSSLQAARSAQMIKGVVAVSNQLIVEPVALSDETIRKNIVASIQKEVTRETKAEITVDKGMVALSGTLASPGEKFLVVNAARSVAGVRSVDDNLDVYRSDEVSDVILETQIQSIIDISADLIDADVAVSFKDGTAVFTGKVGSEAVRSLLIDKAELCGADAADVRGVDIDWSLNNEKRRKKKLDEMDLKKVVDNVQLALRHDPWVAAYASGIRVAAGDNYVLLDGTVGNWIARAAAVKAARNTVGVFRVRDNIKVKWDGDRPSDPEITQDVTMAMARDVYLSDQEIIVRTRNAHVRLYGLVDTEFIKGRAQSVANSQPGVVHVANYLTVLKEWEPVSDRELEESILKKFKWMLFAPSAKVKVNVKNGVAILSGVVSTWNQWQLAMDLAIEAGARRPHNMIEIHGSSTPHHRGDDIYVPD